MGSTRLASMHIELTVDADDAERKLANTKKSVSQSAMGWTELKSGIDLATGALRTVGEAAARVGRAIEEGAALRQSEDQFRRLAESIGSSAGLLNELRAATRGTVSDTELMSSANELMSLKLATNQDEVVRMSNVVGKLGLDMQQLGLTIVNQSVARLDALGLAVDDVVPRYNELKKTMDDKEAFKLAIIEAAEQKIELLGDSADTSVGKINRLKAEWANMVDEQKKGLALAVEPLIDAQIEQIETADKVTKAIKLGLIPATELYSERGVLFTDATKKADDALARYEATLQSVAPQIAYFASLTDKATDTTHAAALTQEELAESEREVSHTTTAQINKNKRLAESLEKEAEASRIAAEAQAELAAKTAGYFNDAITAERGANLLDVAIKDIGDSYVRVSGLTDDQRESLDELTSARDRSLSNIRSLQTGTAGLGKTQEEVAEAIQKEQDAIAALEGRMAPLASQTGEVRKVTRGWAFDMDAVNANLFEQAQAATDDVGMLAALGVATGQLTEEQADAALKTAILKIEIQKIAQAYADGKLSAEDAARAVRDVATAVQNVPSGKTIQFDVIVNRNIRTVVDDVTGEIGSASDSGFDRQHGGPVWPGPSFLVGESGPERVTFGAPGMVTPNNITFNGGITVNSSSPTGSGIGGDIVTELGRQLRKAKTSGAGITGRTI